MAKEEKTGLEEVTQTFSIMTPVIGTLAVGIPKGDQWFNQLPVVAPRSQFTGPTRHLWVCHIQAMVQPRRPLDPLTKTSPPETDPQHKKWPMK